MARVLIVDDESFVVHFISALLRKHGHSVFTSSDGGFALRLLESKRCDAVVCDYRMQPMSGVEFLNHAVDRFPDVPVILVSGYLTGPIVVEAVEQGAFDFLDKPIDIQALIATIDRALLFARMAFRKSGLHAYKEPDLLFGQLIAESPAMKEVGEAMLQVATVETPVHIVGESHTGKSLVANVLFRMRGLEPAMIQQVDCEAVTEKELLDLLMQWRREDRDRRQSGYAGPTIRRGLFLRSVELLPTEAQCRLLEDLEHREQTIDKEKGGTSSSLSLVSSTSLDLGALSDAGDFNGALYRRLAVMALHVQPLRERREDILPLFYHFLRQFNDGQCAEYIVETPVEMLLRGHDWPSNIQDLQGVVQYVAEQATDERIVEDHLPPDIVASQNVEELLQKAVAEAQGLRATQVRKRLANCLCGTPEPKDVHRRPEKLLETVIRMQ